MGKKIKFIEGAAIGAVMGAAAGMLLAPKSGKKIRKDLQKLSSDFYKTLAPQLKKMKKVGEKEYRQLVKSAIARYASAKKLTKNETEDLLGRAESAWKSIKANLSR